MTIVMGLDQHRAQITAEWFDSETGEVSRGRVAPAHRESVRRFLERFRGQELEAALEATTGWRFVVEELRRAGAVAHLAEPAETSALRGNKKRAKNDRADARHLRELLQTGRLPESWIGPDHILDLRARVRLRHSLVDDRGEWQQRMQAVLYHHGVPKRADLRLAPFDRELCRYARRQQGCKALMGHYGIGALTSVTILAELGDVGRFSSSRAVVRYAGMDITVHASDKRRAPGHLSRHGPPAVRWALYMRPPRPPAASAPRTVTTSCKQPDGSGATAPASRSRASCSNAATTPSKTSARRDSRPHELPSCAHA